MPELRDALRYALSEGLADAVATARCLPLDGGSSRDPGGTDAVGCVAVNPVRSMAVHPVGCVAVGRVDPVARGREWSRGLV